MGRAARWERGGLSEEGGSFKKRRGPSSTRGSSLLQVPHPTPSPNQPPAQPHPTIRVGVPLRIAILVEGGRAQCTEIAYC